MGQSTNDRRRKYFSNVDESMYSKERKKSNAIARSREAKAIRQQAKQAAINLSATG